MGFFSYIKTKLGFSNNFIEKIDFKGYWWQNILTRESIKGQTILKFNDEGCQTRNKFQWVGIVTGFDRNENLNCDNVVIEIILHNFSYTDARDNKDNFKEIYKYPLVNADIQFVKGVWVLFT